MRKTDTLLDLTDTRTGVIVIRTRATGRERRRGGKPARTSSLAVDWTSRQKEMTWRLLCLLTKI